MPRLRLVHYWSQKSQTAGHWFFWLNRGFFVWRIPSCKLTWPWKMPIFPGKYHQKGGFHMAMLVYRSVESGKSEENSIATLRGFNVVMWLYLSWLQPSVWYVGSMAHVDGCGMADIVYTKVSLNMFVQGTLHVRIADARTQRYDMDWYWPHAIQFSDSSWYPLLSAHHCRCFMRGCWKAWSVFLGVQNEDVVSQLQVDGVNRLEKAPQGWNWMLQVTWTILPEHELLEHALHWHSGLDATGGKVRLFSERVGTLQGDLFVVLFLWMNTISVFPGGDMDALFTSYNICLWRGECVTCRYATTCVP